ncbi:MAG: hypothetical protein QOG89_1819 [Thermomicrobiales bacterium]|nr:hypothetical protein [Thermomicrobiales bacterium]MEA2530175.1 hypothetical protein [Thermomicrobiales bacterium]
MLQVAPCLLLLLSMVSVMPYRAVAAEPPGGLTADWTAQETEHFRFFVQANDRLTPEAFVEAYGAYAETAYDEISLLFKTTADRKIAVYVYAETGAVDAAMATLDRKEIGGIDAVADPRNLDISIAWPRFAARSAQEAENQLRHATAHILAGIASGFNLPRGFTEGIAQYVERRNTPKLARIASLVQTANQRGGLISWSELNRDIPPQGDEELIAAEAYAVVAYLIQHQGLPEFQRFLAEMKTTPGWRDAMKVAYAPGTSDTLSKQWREKVAIWATTDWDWNLVEGFNLEPAKNLLAKGNYRGAQEILQLSEQLFMALDDQKRRDEVELLKTQCAIGIQAEELMGDTQQALERHTYDRAVSYLAKAKAQYDQLPPEQRPDELIATYEALANAGNEATVKLDAATGLSQSWGDYPEARQAARDAGETFATLGDEERRTQAESVLSGLDTRQRRLVLMLGALAVLTLAWLALWLWARGPSELQWE